MSVERDELDAIRAELAELRKLVDPQNLRQRLERTWDPRGGEPRIIGPDGVMLPYVPALEFTGGSVQLDAPQQRIVIAGGGGHAIWEYPALTAMAQRSNFLIYSGDHTLTYEDYPGLDLTAVQIAAASAGATDASTVIDVWDGQSMAPGDYQYTSPVGAICQDVIVIGAGGGGGGAIGPDPNAHGGGGGGGGAYRRFVMNLGPGGLMNLTLGAPGAKGTNGAVTGTPGGDATPTYTHSTPWQGTSVAKGGGAGSNTAAGVGGDGGRDPAGFNGGDGGTGGVAFGTPTDGTPGQDGVGGSAGGGAGSAIWGTANPPETVKGGRARGDSGGWLGGDGGVSTKLNVSNAQAENYATGLPWGGGGAAAAHVGTGTTPRSPGPGGPALIVVITHCKSPAT